MLRIRLSRVGSKKQPHYRVVVADIDAPRDGKYVESLGFYNPRSEKDSYRINESRALHWLSVGAQPSDAVRRFLEKQGTYKRLERLHAGESFDVLMAEYEGKLLPEAMSEVVAAVAELVSDEEE